ncbi:MAG: BNR-4 repeat-containing protein [Phycisphaerae bacterium]|nr:BNR-4 repeat-containing protein [Phycisphaerae bacterium]
MMASPRRLMAIIAMIGMLGSDSEIVLAASETAANTEGDARVSNGGYRGVWYSCGTANVLPGHKYVYGGGKGTYSAWHRPMAVYAEREKKTFFVYGNPENSPMIGFYDHGTAAFSTPVCLGQNIDMNAHRNPTLLIDENGILYVFRGYNGMPTHVTRSVKPYDISRWEPRTPVEVEKKSSYPQPWQLRPGEIFVSYRREPGWCCRISTDGAATWGPRVNLVKFADCQIYAMTVAEAGGFPRKIHLVWSRLGGGTPEEVRTKHLWARRYNVYYACSDDGGRTWRKSDGAKLELPITEATAEKLYDCGQHGVWLKDIQLDSKGNPIVLFLDADVGTYESTWKVAKLKGRAWSVRDVTTSDHMYDGGSLAILSDNDIRVYGPSAPSQPQYDGGEIEEWTSTDGGQAWNKTARLTSESKYSHNHIKTVLHHERGNGDFRVFWSYGDARYPPESKDVLLHFYGERLDRERVIECQRP